MVVNSGAADPGLAMKPFVLPHGLHRVARKLGAPAEHDTSGEAKAYGGRGIRLLSSPLKRFLERS